MCGPATCVVQFSTAVGSVTCGPAARGYLVQFSTAMGFGIWRPVAPRGMLFFSSETTAHFGHCCKKNFAVHSRLQQLVLKLILYCWHRAAQPPCLQWQMLIGWDLSSLYRFWNVVWNMNEWKATNSSCCTEGKLSCLVFNAYNLPGVVVFCLFSAFFIIHYLCLLSVCMPLSFLIL